MYTFIGRLKVKKFRDCEIILNKLIETSEIYIEDKLFVFECFKILTLNNISFIGDVLRNSLQKEQNLLKQEPQLDNPQHICKMIMLSHIYNHVSGLKLLLP